MTAALLSKVFATDKKVQGGFGFYLRKWIAEAETKFPITGRIRELAQKAARQRAEWLWSKTKKEWAFSEDEREVIALLARIYADTARK